MSKKSFIVRIPFLENQHLVNCALPGLANPLKIWNFFLSFINYLC